MAALLLIGTLISVVIRKTSSNLMLTIITILGIVVAGMLIFKYDIKGYRTVNRFLWENISNFFARITNASESLSNEVVFESFVNNLLNVDVEGFMAVLIYSTSWGEYPFCMKKS